MIFDTSRPALRPIRSSLLARRARVGFFNPKAIASPENGTRARVIAMPALVPPGSIAKVIVDPSVVLGACDRCASATTKAFTAASAGLGRDGGGRDRDATASWAPPRARRRARDGRARTLDAYILTTRAIARHAATFDEMSARMR